MGCVIVSYWSPPEQEDDEEKKKREEMERAFLLRQFLTPEARERLRNISLVKPDLAKKVESMIIQLGLEGRLNHKITDSELKEILIRMQKRRDFRIRGFDYG
jgi:programmed cell death protein 5